MSYKENMFSFVAEVTVFLIFDFFVVHLQPKVLLCYKRILIIFDLCITI